MNFLDYLIPFLYALAMMTVFMTMCAYAVLAERKICSLIQGRLGPNRAKIPIISQIPIIGNILTRLGVFHPAADGLKFLFKEEITPRHVRLTYYYLAPIIALAPALTTMVVLPFGRYIDANGLVQPVVLANIDVGILFILAVSSLGVYGIVLAGWASNSKYPFLGSIRSTAQMISYELAMGLSILPVFLWAAAPGSDYGLSLFGVVQSQKTLWLILWQPISALIFLVAIFAETNRLPFDMAESETDLVGGFHTEYGAFKFGLFFVAEYAHIIMGSALFVLLFLGGWNFLPGMPDPWPLGIFGVICSTLWFLLKIFLMIFFFIWMRWSMPRFRYDHVMHLGWKILLPLAIINLVFYIFIIAIFDKISY